MSWQLSGLQAVFGAAFGALFRDGTLHKTMLVDDGLGGFTTSTADSPVKLMLDSLSEAERAAGGLPRPAVRITVLRAGLGVAIAIAIDDSLTVDGATYRVLQTELDPAGASYTLAAVPVAP